MSSRQWPATFQPYALSNSSSKRGKTVGRGGTEARPIRMTRSREERATTTWKLRQSSAQRVASTYVTWVLGWKMIVTLAERLAGFARDFTQAVLD